MIAALCWKRSSGIFEYAGIERCLEIMEVNLRHDDAVARIQPLINKYHVPLTGTSLWSRSLG